MFTQMAQSIGRVVAATLTALCPLLLAPAAVADTTAATAGASIAPMCRDVTIPVALGDAEDAAKTNVSGWLCQPLQARTRTVQLLVHGAGYTRDYWDSPVGNALYSYSRWANATGYATLAVDRVGVGHSPHVDSAAVTYDATISTLNQVVHGLRAGTYGPSYDNVVIVGHSFGSVYAAGVAATYHDVDGVILTGSGHKVSPSFSALAAANYYPANHEPRFKDLDSGWLVTKPGTIAQLHYYTPGASARVIAADEATKDVVSTAEFATRPDLATVWPQITAPTLLITGQRDIHYCATDNINCASQGSFRDTEAAFFAPTTKLTTRLVPVTGHNLHRHYTALSATASMLLWSTTTIPPR